MTLQRISTGKKPGKRRRPRGGYYWLKADFMVITVALFVSVAVFGIITFNMTIFDPIKKALNDFNFSDLLYSKLNTDHQRIDTNLVLVNIGRLDRAGIAEQVRLIASHHPKVIGLDGFFRYRRDPGSDSALRSVLKESGVVMACYLTGENELNARFDSLETSNPAIDNGSHAFVNLGGANPATSTVRKFSPSEIFRGETLYAMGTRLSLLYDSAAFARLMERNNPREVIHYLGNKDAYICFDALEVFDSAAGLDIVRDKIVLMGYIGDSFDSPDVLEDIYYTPMNSELTGRSHPDMYGVVIHANIVSMILSGNYINEMPVWLCILLSFIVTYFYIVFTTWFKAKKEMLFNVIFPVFLLLLNLLIIYIFFLIYKYFHYSIDSAYFLAPILLYKTFLTYYKRILHFIRKKFVFESMFLLN